MSMARCILRQWRALTAMLAGLPIAISEEIDPSAVDQERAS